MPAGSILEERLVIVWHWHHFNLSHIIPFNQTHGIYFFSFHYQKFSQLALDLIEINHHLDEPFIVNIPRLSTPAVTPDAAIPAAATPAAAATVTPSPRKRVSTMPTNYNTTRKRQVLPKSTREVSIDELVESADRLGLEEDEKVVYGTITCPITRGFWIVKVTIDDGWMGETVDKQMTMIRIVGPSYLCLELCDVEWVEKRLLQVGFIWPKWLRMVQGHARLQREETDPRYKFPENHAVYDSMKDHIMANLSAEDKKKKRVVDYGYFDFDRDMNTDKGSAKVEILKVALEDDDIEEGQTMPPGKEVRMLQIIVEEKLVDAATDGKLDVKERNTPSKLGKDPDGKKAGVNFECRNFVSRLSGYFAKYDIPFTEDEVIGCFNNYTGREEIMLELVSLMLENGADNNTISDVDIYMERYVGNYPQMFVDLRRNISLFGEIDLPPTESVIVPSTEHLVAYSSDSDDDGYDGMSVSAVEKVKRPREDDF